MKKPNVECSPHKWAEFENIGLPHKYCASCKRCECKDYERTRLKAEVMDAVEKMIICELCVKSGKSYPCNMCIALKGKFKSALEKVFEK